MNIYTHEIANFLNIDLKTAMKVQEQLECEDFDFSESSSAKLKRSAKQALKEI